jgi:hypothetical protein
VFHNVRFRPLSIDDFEKARRAEPPIDLPCNVAHDSVTFRQAGKPPEKFGGGILESTLTVTREIKAFGITQGGWLPAGWNQSSLPTFYMIDRNIMREIEAVGKGDDHASPFMSFLSGSKNIISILPILIEGNAQGMMSDFDLFSLRKDIARTIRRCMPTNGISVGSNELQEVKRMTSALDRVFEAELALHKYAHQEFRRPKVKREELIGKIEIKRIELGLNAGSLMRTALLGAASAKKSEHGWLKKLTKVEKEENSSYNVASDMRSLYILLAMTLPKYCAEPVFLTGDKELVKFWLVLGLDRRSRSQDGDNIKWKANPDMRHLPDWTQFRILLNERDGPVAIAPLG